MTSTQVEHAFPRVDGASIHRDQEACVVDVVLDVVVRNCCGEGILRLVTMASKLLAVRWFISTTQNLTASARALDDSAAQLEMVAMFGAEISEVVMMKTGLVREALARWQVCRSGRPQYQFARHR
jgi:hypothetical protein